MERGLIIVYRSESKDDFLQICRRVKKIDPNIQIIGFADWIDLKKIQPYFFKLPVLIIYLVNPPPDDFLHESPMLAVREASKIEEYEHFKKHNLPCLPIEKFEWGMKLDPEIYSDWVVLKPQRLQSTGKDVNMVPTKLIPTLTISDFPADHLIHKDGYYVQKLLKTGTYPKHCRAAVFLDEIIYSANGTLNFPYPLETSSIKELLSVSVASNQHANRTAELVKDPEVNALALKVAKTFPRNPLMAVDILRDEETGKLYVLEVNLGGNVWHFSSEMVRNLPGYDAARKKAMVLQYNAWDRAAEALVRKVNELAR